MSFTYNGAAVQDVTYNGTAVQSITYNGVEVWSAIKPDLKDNTPAQIQYIAQHDLASSLFDIGDWFEMKIGSTSDKTWQPNIPNGAGITIPANYVIRCVLIGINHNATKEGAHMLHFQMGKNTDNVDVGFAGARMNIDETNAGGWESCQLRTYGLVNFFNDFIPAEWREVIKACTKYTDNSTGSRSRSYDASRITATSDKLFLLSSFEVFRGSNNYNEAEADYQQQYAYYANGNSAHRYEHHNPSFRDSCFLRSRGGTTTGFDAVSSSQNADGSQYAWVIKADERSIVSPAFGIG